jgi:hypothetical protein
VYLPFCQPLGFAMWNSVYASPLAAMFSERSSTTEPFSNVQRAVRLADGAVPVVWTDAKI